MLGIHFEPKIERSNTKSSHFFTVHPMPTFTQPSSVPNDPLFYNKIVTYSPFPLKAGRSRYVYMYECLMHMRFKKILIKLVGFEIYKVILLTPYFNNLAFSTYNKKSFFHRYFFFFFFFWCLEVGYRYSTKYCFQDMNDHK